jgi:hypothetical protein
MYWLMIIFTTFLFVIFTPAVFVRFPPNGSKLSVAFVHGLIFAIIYHLIHHSVWRILYLNNSDTSDISGKTQ